MLFYISEYESYNISEEDWKIIRIGCILYGKNPMEALPFHGVEWKCKLQKN